MLPRRKQHQRSPRGVLGWLVCRRLRRTQRWLGSSSRITEIETPPCTSLHRCRRSLDLDRCPRPPAGSACVRKVARSRALPSPGFRLLRVTGQRYRHGFRGRSLVLGTVLRVWSYSKTAQSHEPHQDFIWNLHGLSIRKACRSATSSVSIDVMRVSRRRRSLTVIRDGFEIFR